jgi:hypothetical protein
MSAEDNRQDEPLLSGMLKVIVVTCAAMLSMIGASWGVARGALWIGRHWQIRIITERSAATLIIIAELIAGIPVAFLVFGCTVRWLFKRRRSAP